MATDRSHYKIGIPSDVAENLHSYLLEHPAFLLHEGVDDRTVQQVADRHTGTWFQVSADTEGDTVISHERTRQGCKRGALLFVAFELALLRSTARLLLNEAMPSLPYDVRAVPWAAESPPGPSQPSPDIHNSDTEYVDDGFYAFAHEDPTTQLDQLTLAIASLRLRWKELDSRSIWDQASQGSWSRLVAKAQAVFSAKGCCTKMDSM